MINDQEYPELEQLLFSRGHTSEEIVRIIQRVRIYEKEAQLDSVMDSIGNGTLNLGVLIAEALAEPTGENENEKGGTNSG